MGIPAYIEFCELRQRFEAINWIVERNRDHFNFKSPDGKTIVTVGEHQYDDKPSRWQKIKSSFTRENKDLDFIWVSPFEIPYYFNLETQKIEEPEVEEVKDLLVKEVSFCNIPLNDLDRYVIRHEERWKKIADLDFNNRQILLKDGTVLYLQNLDSIVTIRPSLTKEFLKKQKELQQT